MLLMIHLIWVLFLTEICEVSADEEIVAVKVDENDPGVKEAVKFLAQAAVHLGFFKSISQLQRPINIRGTRTDAPGFVYDLKFRVRTKGYYGKMFECLGTVWDENRNRKFVLLDSVNCFRLN